MKYEKCEKVFSCCGQYIVPTKAVSDKNIYCPRCGRRQVKSINLPNVLIVKA